MEYHTNSRLLAGAKAMEVILISALPPIPSTTWEYIGQEI